MTCGITNATCYTTISMHASMSLSVVLNQFQIVLLAKSTNLVSISIATIKMNNGYSLGFRSNDRLYEVLIYL